MPIVALARQILAQEPDGPTRDLALAYLELRVDAERVRARNRALALALLEKSCALEALREGPIDGVLALLVERERAQEFYRMAPSSLGRDGD